VIRVGLQEVTMDADFKTAVAKTADILNATNLTCGDSRHAEEN
jgi:hypothetical protein